MVRAPRPGRVKTRLGRDIGPVRAAWWYRHQTARLLRRIGRDPRWQTMLAVTPDHTASGRGPWPAALSRLPQGAGDLGTRMARLLRAVPGPVLLIGSDIPGIDRRTLARAFRALQGRDLVFGPATDGGFWLVGARRGTRFPRHGFRGVRWSHPQTLADTLRGLDRHRIALTATLSDVDTAADLP